jgi:CubicO group peptidase (beta-lactamase class C family)
MKPLVAAVAAAMLAGVAPAVAQPALPSSPGSRVDQLVERYRVGRRIPGIAVAVVSNGRVIKATGYGVANLELGSPVTPRTLFGLGSISKQFTATAIMQLVEEGRVQLDDPMAKHLDSLPPHWSGITVRQLLTHTSGLPEEKWLPSFVEFDRFEHRQLDVLRTIFADSLEFAPGAGWAYRNSAYRLLGMIIERVSGESYWAWLDRRIFRPIGMRATRSSDPKTIIPNRAKGYGKERGRIVNRDAVTESAAFSEGALISSVLDLARWDSSLYHPRVLSQASLDQMWTPITLSDGTTRPYGFGWSLGPTNGLRTVSHGGGLPGFVTRISRYLAKRLTVIVLTNAEWSDPGALANLIAGHYQPELAPRPEPAIADPDPGFTSELRVTIERLARGQLDLERLAPNARDDWSPEAVQEIAQSLGRLGAMRGLELVARNEFGDLVRRRYRVRLERGAFRLVITTDLAGMVRSLDLEEAILER